jgi:hypothetical protein
MSDLAYRENKGRKSSRSSLILCNSLDFTIPELEPSLMDLGWLQAILNDAC